MADIQLRFNKDMLVLSAPVDATLAKQGLSVEFDRQYLNLMEQESVVDALRLEIVAGAQCICTTTSDITQARLAHARMEGDAHRLAEAALQIAHEVNPQHILVEIGPCGLPLDASSKASLNENRGQYADAARAFEEFEFDAYFLNGFTSVDDLKCALMGVKQVTDLPVFASVLVGSADSCQGQVQAKPRTAETPVDEITESLPFTGYAVLDDPLNKMSYLNRHTPLDPAKLPQAVEVMIDMGAAVVGFETPEPLVRALEYAATCKQLTDLPLLAQLRVVTDPLNARAKGLVPIQDLQEYTPDTLVYAGEKLRDAGVQFLRATGEATPACTGALVAAVSGEDVIRR